MSLRSGCRVRRGTRPGGVAPRPHGRQPVLPPRAVGRPRAARRRGVAALRPHACARVDQPTRCAAHRRARRGGARGRSSSPPCSATTFDLATLVAASEADPGAGRWPFVDAAIGGRADRGRRPDGGRVLVRARADPPGGARPHAAVAAAQLLHARAAEALERQPPDAALVPRLANHYLAAEVLGLTSRRCATAREAGQLAERSLAFEDAAVWFERAASLPECDRGRSAPSCCSPRPADLRAGLRLPARASILRAAGGDRASPTCGCRRRWDSRTRRWRPGILGPRAADLLSSALDDVRARRARPALRPRPRRASGGRSTFAGETARAHEVGARAIDLARELGDDATLAHALITSLWHGTAPTMAELQLERTAEVSDARASRHATTRRSARRSTSGAMVALPARPAGRAERGDRACRTSPPRPPASRTTDYVYGCLAHAAAFIRGDFAAAERWAEADARENDDRSATTWPRGPTACRCSWSDARPARLERSDRSSTATSRSRVAGCPACWRSTPSSGSRAGMRRALHARRSTATSTAHTTEAQWPMELVFMTEARARARRRRRGSRTLRPLLASYAGMNLVAARSSPCSAAPTGSSVGSAALLGDHAAAERHFAVALDMDRRMRSVVHVAETLAHHARASRRDRATSTAAGERAGRRRASSPRRSASSGCSVVLDALAAAPAARRPERPRGRGAPPPRRRPQQPEIGARLHISANTAANHVRSILMKTGAANRTQAAMYAAQHTRLTAEAPRWSDLTIAATREKGQARS